MKKFYWKLVQNLKTKTRTVSLLEINENAALFWGSINIDDMPLQFCAYPQNRSTLMLCEDRLGSLRDAMAAVEEFLRDEGVILESDEVEEYTEMKYE